MNFEELEDIAAEMASFGSGLEIRTRRYFLKSYPDCFIGSQMVDWFIKYKQCSRQSALALGNELVKARLVRHTVDLEKPLLDGYYFYVFTEKVKKKKGRLKSLPTIPTTIKGKACFMADSKNGVDIKDRKYHLKTYRCCFVASEAVDWMLTHLGCRTREEATKLGEKFVDEGFIEHVVQPQPFKDAYLFFQFTRYAQDTPEIIEESSNESISPDDFEQIKVLGEGGYGKVSLVRKKDTGVIYAMKTVNKSRIKSEKALEHIITEKKVLVNDNPFLLHLYFSFQTPLKLYLVTDFLSGGDMFFHLSKKNGQGFSPVVARFFCAELVLALEHLHQCGVVYRDLKLENVLLDSQGHICLADFGLSKLLDDEDRTQTFCGSQGYLAPEILRGESYTYSVDWFSLGVILYEMLSGINPFLGANFHDTCTNILHKPIRFPATFSRATIDILKRLLDRNPNSRLKTAAEIKRQSWFKGIKWPKLAVKKIKPPFHITVAEEASTEHFDQLFTRMQITSEDTSSMGEDTSDSLFEDFDYTAT